MASMEVKRWVGGGGGGGVRTTTTRSARPHARTHSLTTLTHSQTGDSEWLEWQRTSLLPVQAPRAACWTGLGTLG